MKTRRRKSGRCFMHRRIRPQPPSAGRLQRTPTSVSDFACVLLGNFCRVSPAIIFLVARQTWRRSPLPTKDGAQCFCAAGSMYEKKDGENERNRTEACGAGHSTASSEKFLGPKSDISCGAQQMSAAPSVPINPCWSHQQILPPPGLKPGSLG